MKVFRRHFRFGNVDGSSWSSHNGLAQGCPAAPDMLNILLEPFHRWAVANGFGVSLVGGGRASSASFADDVVLIAGSREEIEIYHCCLSSVVHTSGLAGPLCQDPGVVQPTGGRREGESWGSILSIFPLPSLLWVLSLDPNPGDSGTH